MSVVPYTIDGGFNGESLKELIVDFDEFSALVTSPLMRLKIKKAIREFEEDNMDGGISGLIDKVSLYTGRFRGLHVAPPFNISNSFWQVV